MRRLSQRRERGPSDERAAWGSAHHEKSHLRYAPRQRPRLVVCRPADIPQPEQNVHGRREYGI